MTAPTTSNDDPICRTEPDELEDLKKAVDRAVDGAYLDWPNEAGVRAINKDSPPPHQTHFFGPLR